MSTERTETCVELNVGVAKKCMAVIRDTAMLIADSDNPDDIGYALQELHSSLSDYTWREPVLFCIEDAEEERNEDIDDKRFESIPANPLEELHQALVRLNSLFTRRCESKGAH
jgi:hypothetical protein